MVIKVRKILLLKFSNFTLDNFSTIKTKPAIGALNTIANPAALPAKTQDSREIFGRNFFYLLENVANKAANI